MPPFARPTSKGRTRRRNKPFESILVAEQITLSVWSFYCEILAKGRRRFLLTHQFANAGHIIKVKAIQKKRIRFTPHREMLEYTQRELRRLPPNACCRS